MSALANKANGFAAIYKKSHRIQDLQTSLNTCKLASEIIDKKRNSYKAEGSKLILGEQVSTIYELAIATAMTLYHTTRENRYVHEAFALAEKGKAAVLFQSLQESRAKLISGIPPDLIEKEKDLRIELTYYEAEIQNEKLKKDQADSSKIREFEDRYFATKRDYEQLIDSFEKSYPKYYELKYKVVYYQKRQG